jgi:GTPase SAR1 family protein
MRVTSDSICPSVHSRSHETFHDALLSRHTGLRIESPPAAPALSNPPTDLLGKRYFQTRDRLKNAIERLAELGAEYGIAAERGGALMNLSADLEDPFLLVVVGETGAGKSTLLNALFGGESQKAGVGSPSGSTAPLQNGAEARESEFSGNLAEVLRPITTLEDFHLLILPGIKAIGSAYDQVTERFLPKSELVLFVFSVKNLWGDPTWEFLERIHREWSRKIVLVLQQCDLRTEEEVAAILGHFQKTVHHRFGRHFPIFTVSAKTALLAQTPVQSPAGARRPSGIESLRLHLSGVVESSVLRLVKLTHACRAARVALEEIKARLGVISEIIRADDEILGKLESAALRQIERTVEKHEALFDDFEESFVSAGVQAEKLLHAEFRLVSTLLPRRHRIGLIEDRISAITMKAVRRGIESGARAVTEDIEKLRELLSVELRERFHLDPGANGSGRPDWSAARQRLSDSVKEATETALHEMNLLEELGGLFRRRTRVIWGCIIAAILSSLAGVALTMQHRGLPGDVVTLIVDLVAGVVYTMLERGPLNGLALAAAVACLIVATRVASYSVKRARVVYKSVLDRHQERITLAQRGAFREQTTAFYRDFVAHFEPLRKVCREHRRSYEPNLRKIEKVESSLVEVERILHPVELALRSRS